LIGSFTCMAKSGEVYQSDDIEEIDGYIQNTKKRPRNIYCPCKKGCGILTFIQSLFWDRLREILPGFIQGCKKGDLEEMINSKIND